MCSKPATIRSGMERSTSLLPKWQFGKIIPALKEHGHEVINVNLPGHGADNTPFADITLRSYVDAVKAAIGAAETLVITRSAFPDALSLGFNRWEISAVIQGIQRPMYNKSMTTFADHRTWQDVYHVPVDGLVL